MDILIADLHEDGAGIGQQIAGDGQPIAQVGQVGVDAVAPGVAEGLDLLRLAGDVVGLAVLHVAAGGGPLEVAVELDAVGRVDVDALHLAAQPLALGQAEPSPAGCRRGSCGSTSSRRAGRTRSWPRSLGQAVEVGEEVELLVARLPARCSFGLAQQVVDQDLGVDLLLDVERRRVDDEVATSPARPCRARRAAGRGRGCGARRPRGSALCSSSCMTDWYSAVGMFLRVASSCVRVSTASWLLRGLLGHGLLPSMRRLRGDGRRSSC